MIAEHLAKTARERAVRREINLKTGKTVFFEYPGAKPAAKVVVMVHGYRGNHHGLEAIAAGLQNEHVYIPDLPGFGQSDALDTEHSVENYANWLREFVNAIGVSETVHLIGHSFGTLVVGQYAANNPTKAVGLINPVSQPALEGPRAALTALAKFYYLVAGFAPKFAGEWLLRNKAAVMVMSIAMAKTKDRLLRSWIHKQHLTNFSDFKSIRVAVEGYRASISIDLSKLARRIQAPVLIIAADLDDITAIQAQRQVANLYQRSTYKEITGVGHLVHYEAPGKAAVLIHDFLETL